MTTWPLHISVYGAGDAAATGAFASLQRFLWQQVHELSREITNEAIAGTIQFDGTTAPSFRMVLDPRGRFRPIGLSETNTGDPDELVAFSRWAQATCPADRHALVLSGHGLAFQDAATERLLARGMAAPVIKSAKRLFGPPMLSRALLMDQSDFLSVPELSAALAAIAGDLPEGKLDTIVFDACLMSNLEILYEIAPSCAFAVGAMDEISGAGLNIAGAARLLRREAGDRTLEPSDIAAAFADAYRPKWPSDSCVVVDLSSKNLKKGVEALTSSVSHMMAWLDEDETRAGPLREAIAASSRNLVRYRSQSLADVAGLRDALAAAALPDTALTSFRKAVQHFGKAVTARKVGEDYRAATGLSLFAPTDRSQFNLHAADHAGLILARKSGWHDLLARLFRAPKG